MFDDRTSQSGPGAPPSNLPIGEPEDIFASSDDVVEAPAVPSQPTPSQEVTESMPPASAVPPSSPSALSAGVLKPKQSPAAPPAPTAQIPPTPGDQPSSIFDTPPLEAVPAQKHGSNEPAHSYGYETKDSYKVQGPSFLRTAILIIVFVLLLVGVVGAAYWAYTAFAGDNRSPVPAPQPINSSVDASPDDAEKEEGEVPSPDEQVLFGELVDSDSDGLDDEQERSIGTDPRNWDTDGDELSDYDEVAVWKTDPFSIDTDGDGYLDGAEVKNGYNPSGQGRIFEPPAPDESVLSPSTQDTQSSARVRPPSDSTTQSSQTPKQPVITGDGKACDADGDCFAAAATVCEKAIHTRTTVLDLWDVLGVRQYVAHYMQILGYTDDGICEWYMRIDDVDIAFKDDIAPEIQAENRRALEATIGWDGTCRMQSDAFAALVQKWNNGQFSSDDLTPPACQGRLFEI